MFAKRPQASAKRPQSVRKAFAKRSRRVGHAGESTESKIVAKRRLSSLFTFRTTKVSTVTGIGGGPGRETQNCRHFWSRLGFSRLKSVNSHRDRGGRGRETQNCRHFWSRLGSSRFKSVHSQRDRGGRGRETQNCRHFWSRLVPGVSEASTVTGIGGSWSRNAELSSLLDSPLERGKERGERRKER